MWDVFKRNREKWIFAGVAIGLFLVFRFVIPLVYPFLFGAMIAAALSRGVSFLHQKLHMGRGICAAILLAVVLFLIVLILGWFGYGIADKGYEIFCNYEEYMQMAEQKADVCCHWIENRLHLQRGFLMEEMRAGVTRMSAGWQETLMPDIFEGSVGGMKKLFSAGAFLLFTFLSAVFIAKEWDEYGKKLFCGCKGYAEKILDYLKIFLGAQLKIIGVIALICLAGFWLSGTEGAPGLAILTALMDVLPFIGTGIVIVPILLWKLVSAEYYHAFVLLATYICCMIAREYLEPRFISAKTGISPVLTLLGIYAGTKIMGIAGIFLGPLYLLLLHIFYEETIKGEAFAMEE